jgi:hypothetical protein
MQFVTVGMTVFHYGKRLIVQYVSPADSNMIGVSCPYTGREFEVHRVSLSPN